MQQVLNRADRNQAFVKFLVFFLVTIVLIVAAVFINFRLPSQENKRYREQAEILRQQDGSELKYVSIMHEAVSLLDSMDKNASQIGNLKPQLDGKLVDLGRLQQNDNSIYGQLNKIIGSALGDLEMRKVNANDLSNKLSSSEGLSAELKQCKSDLEQLKRDNDNLRARLPN